MNSKVGILTYYYKTHNYGGMLQSYALSQYLNDAGFEAEQICYTRNDERKFEDSPEPKVINTANLSLVERIRNKLLRRKFADKIIPEFELRNNKFNAFELKVPHSGQAYSLKTIGQTNNIYDSFVVGSDQIWTFNWFNPSFFLEFADDNKKKISYAASVGKSKFTDKEKAYLKNTLSTFDAVSVRENDLVDSLSEIVTDKKIDFVVDPTLLLTKEDWDKVAAKRLVDEKYLFCYFLGSDKKIRKLADEFAKEHKLKVVTIPFANEAFNVSDFDFGDYKIYDADPSDFISLIKYSDYVFTDSFHASVFSLLYNREFVTFERAEFKKMSSRLYSLTQLFECEERFCNSSEKFTLDYINSLNKLDYNRKFNEFENLKMKSEKFLTDSIN